MEFDPVQGLELLKEILRVTALPAGPQEICDHGLSLTAKGLGAAAGAIFLREGGKGNAPLTLRGAWGDASGLEPLDEAELALASVHPIEVSDRPPDRLAVPIPKIGGSGSVGMIVFERPRVWSSSARIFTRCAVHALASSLETARRLEQHRDEGVLLVQRNVELETLSELAQALPSRYTEQEALQVVLDLVLEKLGLRAGWIFWGESSRKELRLAASRGISDDFVRESRDSGIGTCLCRDVFATGRLRYARNTTDCPRLPDLVRGSEPMTHACIPLKFEHGTMGVMNIANRPGKIFSPAELKFLETVGNQLCLAVDKLRTARAEHRRNAEARALASLARAIGGSLEIEQVLASVGQYAAELLSADRCGIFLGSSASSLQFSYLTGIPLEGLDLGHSVDFVEMRARGIVRALTEKRTLVVHSTREDTRINPDLAERWAVGSALLVPLVAHGRLQGLLVAGRTGASNWTEEDVTMADALAGHAAAAIEGAHLFREVQDALTQLQQAQTGMVRAERLAAVGMLAASLAHEVRNPLNAIHLQLVLLARRAARLEGDQREELAGIVDTAQREIARLDGLVEDFLSLSSIDKLSRSETDLEDIVRDVILLMEPEARDRGVSATESFDGALPRVLIDREKIKQVLINLVRNAIEAMPNGGTVTLTTRKNGTEVLLDVADTGPGIAPGLDVFDFFMTTKRGGTGLGLPIARRIVETHGGSLTYKSQPGKGTAFTIALRTASDK